MGQAPNIVQRHQASCRAFLFADKGLGRSLLPKAVAFLRQTQGEVAGQVRVAKDCGWTEDGHFREVTGGDREQVFA